MAKSENLTPLSGYSDAGNKKLTEMARNSAVMSEFLQFQGRVFKHSPSVALEFFVQKPDTQFIASARQWELANSPVKPGETAIEFFDHDGNIYSMYDFSQCDAEVPPWQWTVTSRNAAAVKAGLDVPEGSSLLETLTRRACSPELIVDTMQRLNIPPQQHKAFGASMTMCIGEIIAGRLAISGGNFAVKPNHAAFQMLQSNAQRMMFLAISARAARRTLLEVENFIVESMAEKQVAAQEDKKDDLRTVDEPDRIRKAGTGGERVPGDSERAAAELSDESRREEGGRRDGMGSDTGASQQEDNGVVPGVQTEHGERNHDVVHLQPDRGDISAEHRDGADDGGRTDRVLRTGVDVLHGGQLPGVGGSPAVSAPVSDDGAGDRPERMGVSDDAGQAVRTDEPAPEHGIRGQSDLGANPAVLHGQHGDAGENPDPADRSGRDGITESPQEKPLPDTDGGSSVSDANSDEKTRLLHEELKRGSEVQYSKLRISAFYLNRHPNTKEFAAFLREEYGIGGRSGSGSSDVWHDGKGMRITSADKRSRYQFSWAQVAKELSVLIDRGEYLTAADIQREIEETEHLLSDEETDEEDRRNYTERLEKLRSHPLLSVQSPAGKPVPIPSETREAMLRDFKEKHGLAGTLIVKQNRGKSDGTDKTYDLILKTGSAIEYQETLFVKHGKEIFSAELLEKALAEHEQSDVFKAFLASRPATLFTEQPETPVPAPEQPQQEYLSVDGRVRFTIQMPSEQDTRFNVMQWSKVNGQGFAYAGNGKFCESLEDAQTYIETELARYNATHTPSGLTEAEISERMTGYLREQLSQNEQMQNALANSDAQNQRMELEQQAQRILTLALRSYLEGNAVAAPLSEREVSDFAMHYEQIPAVHDRVTDELLRSLTESQKRDTPVNISDGEFQIYQIKPGEKYHFIRWESFDSNRDAGLTAADYDLVYTGRLADIEGETTQQKLNAIFRMLNDGEKPEGYAGHSLSTSDVVLIAENGTQTAYYVDTVGFQVMPDFLKPQPPEPISVPGYDLTIDTTQTPYIQLGYTREEYLGGIDADGHERRDNIAEQRHIFWIATEPDGTVTIDTVDGDELNYDLRNPDERERLVTEIKRFLDTADMNTLWMDGGTDTRSMTAMEPPKRLPEEPVLAAEDAAKIYQLVRYRSADGADLFGESYDTLEDAQDAGNDAIRSGLFTGYAVLNRAERKVEVYDGDFPLQGVFSDEVYANSSEWQTLTVHTRGQQPAPAEDTPEFSGTIREGDRFRYMGKEWEVSNLQGGIYPDDVVIMREEQTGQHSYTVQQNVDRFTLAREGVYLGNRSDSPQEKPQPRDFTDQQRLLTVKASAGSLRTMIESNFDQPKEQLRSFATDYVDDIVTEQFTDDEEFVMHYFGDAHDQLVDSVFESVYARVDAAVKNIYQVVTYSEDSGDDDSKAFPTLEEAIQYGRLHMTFDEFDTFAVLNTQEHRIEHTEDGFPPTGVFSEQVYRNSGMLPETEPVSLAFDIENMVRDANLETIAQIEVGDQVMLPSGTFVVDSIDGDFSISMTNTDSSAIESRKGWIGHWKEHLLEEAGDRPIVLTKASAASEPEQQETDSQHDEQNDTPVDHPAAQPAPTTTLYRSSRIFPFVTRHQPTQSERLYRLFCEMYRDIANGTHEHERYESPHGEKSGYEPLAVENLGGGQYSWSTFYFQEGDLMADPDFCFLLDHEHQRLEILSYQLDGLSYYQSCVDESGNVDLRLRRELERTMLQNLRNAQQANRVMVQYTDAEGNRVDIQRDADTDTAEETVTQPVKPADNDRSPELRAVLNDFAEQYGLGHLDIEMDKYRAYLNETFADGTQLRLGVFYPDNNSPDAIRKALEHWAHECEYQGESIAEGSRRKVYVEMHGKAELPPVPDLPEIAYAANPRQKIRDNISALRELKRLRECEESGLPLYNKQRNSEHSREYSDMVLRHYSGWGSLGDVFDETKDTYEHERNELKRILTPEQYAEIRATVTDAHYTPQFVVDAMYKAIQSMGLSRDSRILEPACGTGNFITRMPHGIGGAGVVGVEIDSITAEIATRLHAGNPNVTIMHSPFERSGLQNGSFDLVIGNVPFGEQKMYDPDYSHDWLIHDAFFRKALDKVAPGGVVAFITSSGTMDKQNSKVREYLATQAELVGAVRLPNTAFAEAGTGVTADIIFLKKRETPLLAHEAKPDWCYLATDPNGLRINSYFVEHPDMVLGTMRKTSYFDRLTCDPDKNRPLSEQLDDAISNIRAQITVRQRVEAMLARTGMVQAWGKDDSFHLKDGKIYFRSGDRMEEVKGNRGGELNKKNYAMLVALIELRTITRELLDKQKTHCADEELAPMREKLNTLYDKFLSDYKTHLSEPTVRKLFGRDADYPILQSLENFNSETQTYEKADIFQRRTVSPVEEITAVATVEEAYQVAMDRRGKPDIPYMATLLQSARPDTDFTELMPQVAQELLEKGLVFVDPQKPTFPDDPYAQLTDRAEYLSGNVREKLTFAQEKAAADPSFQRNVDALTPIIPEDIHAEEITVRMGVAWIDAEDYTEFLQSLSGRYSPRCTVEYIPETGEFAIMRAGSKKDLNINESSTYGTEDLTMYEIAEKLLNQTRITVNKAVPSPKDPSKMVMRTDPAKTRLAHEKARQIEEKFAEWIFADPKRKAKYEERYNQLFNSLVGRQYDGSHLTFNGMASDFTPRQHQRDCVARAVYGGNTLAAHVVGAGKSAVFVTSVMKKKELGLIHKACVVVPKALTEQTAREWRSIFPAAKLLTVSEMDLSTPAKRETFTARIATGDYDAVILSREQFDKMPMSQEYQVAYIQHQIDELEDMLTAQKLNGATAKSPSVMKIEQAKKKLQTRLENTMNPKKTSTRRKDEVLDFQQLGFDYLVIDEAHAYKNGFVATKMSDVSGVTVSPSGRAQDMQMKCDYFNETLGQGHILFCTGTPYASPYQH